MLFFRKSFTVLDIGASHVKAVRLKRGKNSVRLLNQGSARLPEDTFDNGEIEDISVLASELEYLFSEMGYKPSSVVTSVPNKNLVIRNIELPGVVADELDNTLQWEADEYLPYPAEDAVLDYIMVEEGTERVNIILVASQAHLLNSYQELFGRLNWNLSVVNVQPLGLLSILENRNSEFPTSAVIDLGASGSRIIIGDGEGVYLFRTLDIGGQNFTEVIMEKNSVGLQEAEQYKYENGLLTALKQSEEELEDDADLEADLLNLSDEGTVEEVMLSTADDLVYEISRSLDYFFRNNPNHEIENYYLTGGCSLLKGLKEYLEQEAEISLEYLDPFTELETENQDQLNDIQYSVALGLGFSEVLS